MLVQTALQADHLWCALEGRPLAHLVVYSKLMFTTFLSGMSCARILLRRDHLMMPLPLPLPMAEPLVEPAIPPALVPRGAGIPLPLEMELAPRVVLDEVVEGGAMVDLFGRVVFGVGGFSTKLVSVVL